MVMYANEVKTKEKEKLPEIKINYNIYLWHGDLYSDLRKVTCKKYLPV